MRAGEWECWWWASSWRWRPRRPRARTRPTCPPPCSARCATCSGSRTSARPPATRSRSTAPADDPSPSQPLALRVGAVHNHSGYSDGDPDTTPADYFRAARDGHNTADAGGDTGVILDYLLSSEHSENEKLPITTAEACIDPSGIPDALAALDLEGILAPAQVLATSTSPTTTASGARPSPRPSRPPMCRPKGSTTASPPCGASSGRTTTSTTWACTSPATCVNAKIDGSYLTMDVMWSWLREPAETGGGNDALVVFNHPGGWPSLSPFDGDLPHNQILNDTLGGRELERPAPRARRRRAGRRHRGQRRRRPGLVRARR